MNLENYPESQKVLAVKEESQIIGNFLAATKLVPVNKINSVLFTYYGIDEQKFDAEKEALLTSYLRQVELETTYGIKAQYYGFKPSGKVFYNGRAKDGKFSKVS